MADGGIGDDESADHSPCLPIILAVGHNERFEHDYSPDSDQFPWPSMDRRPARVLVGYARSVAQSSSVTVRLQRATAAVPVYSAAEFPHVRIETCRNCNCYLLSMDMTRDAEVVPAVDDTAALPLHIWARDQIGRASG